MWGGQAWRLWPGSASASCQDVPVTLAARERAVLGSLGCPFVPWWRWGAVVLATGPFPLKRSLEVKIGGNLGPGALAREGPLSPRVAEKSPPPSRPACSDLSVRTLGKARSPPWDWNAGGGSRGGGGGRTFPARQALCWQLLATPHPCAACHMSPKLKAAAGAGGFSSGRGMLFWGWGQRSMIGAPTRGRK